MKRIIKYSLYTTVIILICHTNLYSEPTSGNKNEVVASINGYEITVDEFKMLYEFAPAFIFRKKNPKQRFLEYLINERLIALEAKANSLDTMKIVTDYRNEIKNDLITEELFKDDILTKIEITEKEIDDIVKHKNTILKLKWLYRSDSTEIMKVYNNLKKISFDSLYIDELESLKFKDQRELEITAFNLRKNRPRIYELFDKLIKNKLSNPIKLNDGYYIIKLENMKVNIIGSQTRKLNLAREAEVFITKEKTEKLSNDYVNKILLKEDPVIKKNSYHIVRSYIGKLLLEDNIYKKWQLEKYLNEAIERIEDQNVNEQLLVQGESLDISIEKFLKWFRNRIQFLDIAKNDLRNFSASIEKIIWQSVRDELLISKSLKRDYAELQSVREQLKWWENKILFSISMNNIEKSISIKNKEINAPVVSQNSLALKLYRVSQKLRSKSQIEIDYGLLEEINVKQHYDPKAIELYSAKKGGVFPREPFPTIDRIWAEVD